MQGCRRGGLRRRDVTENSASERGSKGRIELDQRQMPGSAGEQASDRAAAGTDLYYGIIGNVSERRDDFAARICIY